jgi:hypothetical protein
MIGAPTTSFSIGIRSEEIKWNHRERGLMREKQRSIISVTTEVTVYPSAGRYKTIFSIPKPVLTALDLRGPGQYPPVYIVVRDIVGNLIHHGKVTLVSGPEIEKSNFKRQVGAGQLYPGQRIRLEVSLP